MTVQPINSPADEDILFSCLNDPDYSALSYQEDTQHPNQVSSRQAVNRQIFNFHQSYACRLL